MALFARKHKPTADAPEVASDAQAIAVGAPRPVKRPGPRRRMQEALAQLEALDAGAPVQRTLTDALTALLDSIGLVRGALLVHEPRGHCLVLAAERGLGARGRRRLARVRRGDATSWDMPLHGLMNHRAYLIERPSENRFVPALLDPGDEALSTIACIPFYRGRTPVGSLIALAVGREPLGDGQVHLLDEPLRRLASLVEELRKRHGPEALTPAVGRTAAGEGAVVPAGGATAGAPDTRAEAPAPAIGPGVRSDAGHASLDAHEQGMRADVARLREAAVASAAEWRARSAEWDAERKRLTALVEAAHAEVHALDLARRQAETIGDAARGAAAEAHARLADVTAELEQRRAEDAGRERELGLLRAEREKLAASVGSLTDSLKGALAEARAGAAAAVRAGELEVEVAAARQAAEAAAHQVAAREESAGALRATLAALEAERGAWSDRCAAFEREVDALRAALAAQAAVRQEHGGAAQQETLARETALRQALDAAEAQRHATAARLGVEIAALRAERDGLDRRLRETEARHDAVEAESAARDRDAQAEVGAVRAELAGAREELGRMREALALAEREAARRGEDAAALGERLATLEGTLGTRTDEAAVLARRLAVAEAELGERCRSVAALEEAVARLEAERVTTLAAVPTPPRGAEDGARAPAPTAAPTAAAPSAAAPAPGPITGTIVIVEPAAPIAKALANGCEGTRVVAPGADPAALAATIVQAGAAVVGLNLAAKGPAGGLALLREIRRSGIAPEVRLWAYVAPAEASKGIPIGFVDWLPLPVESDALLGLLLRSGARGNRVLSVGIEMDTLLGARARLTKEGVSLSMAWDSKQGLELLEIVNPGILVVNLDLPRGDGFRALGRLAGKGPCRTVLLLGGAAPPADAVSLLLGDAVHHSPAAFVSLADVAAALRAAGDPAAAERVAGAAEPARDGRGKGVGSGPGAFRDRQIGLARPAGGRKGART